MKLFSKETIGLGTYPEKAYVMYLNDDGPIPGKRILIIQIPISRWREEVYDFIETDEQLVVPVKRFAFIRLVWSKYGKIRFRRGIIRRPQYYPGGVEYAVEA